MDQQLFTFGQKLIIGTYCFDALLCCLHENGIKITHFDTNVLDNVHKFLCIETEYTHTQNGVQERCTIMMADLLMSMATANYHNTETVKCKYHQESLLSHSILAMLKCIEVMPIGHSLEFKTRVAITALFHDIGKIECHRIHKNGITYAFHGECGAAILQLLWSPNFKEFFTEKEWSNSCTAIKLHMCGYHCKDYDDKETIQKMNLLREAPIEVKEILHWLMYGDECGKVSECTSTVEEVIGLMYLFKKAIEPEFDIFNVFDHCGTLIKLCGSSCTGKSYTANLIKNYLIDNGLNENMVIHIDRDHIMSNVVLRHMNLPPLLTKPHSSQYLDLYTYYKQHNLREQVDNEVRKLIENNCNKVVILDTVMNRFKSIDNVLPNIAANMFRINVYLYNDVPLTQIDADRLGCSLEKQLSLYGNRTLTHCLGNDYICLNNMTALTTGTMKEHISKPHLCYNICRTPHGTFGVNDVQNILSHVITAMNYNPDMIQYLSKFKSYSEIKEHFTNNRYIVSQPSIFKEDEVFSIKYLEHNKQYYHQWMRESRGSVFLKHNDKYVCIKSLLQRGIEYVLDIHHDKVNENSGGMFDQVQQMVIKKFKEGGALKSFLSFKVDGSLLGILLFPRDEIGVKVEKALLNDPFSKILVEKSKDLEFIPVICSQGTFSLQSNMGVLGHYITSMITLTDMSHESLEELAVYMTPTEVFEEHIVDTLLERLQLFWNFSPKTLSCLSFETTCKGRVDAWKNDHPELTIAYPISSFKFLGCTYNVGMTCGNFRGHFQLGSLANDCGFMEPLYWECDDTVKVKAMVDSVSKMLRNEMSISEFMTMFPASNIHDNVDYNMDYEGFVIYVQRNNNAIGIGIMDFDVDYGKAKTTEYYKCHKMTLGSVIDISNLNYNVLPIVRKIKTFKEDIIIQLGNVIKELQSLIDACIKGYHDLYLYNATLYEKRKMILSFQKSTDLKAKSKMVINAFENFEETMQKIVLKYINMRVEDVTMFKNIMTRLYNADTLETIMQDDMVMSRLFNALL